VPARYYSRDNPDKFVTPSGLKRLGRQKQVEYMVTWFHDLYEDPGNETPYISREGGYQYIWGGPFDAAEELGGEFGGIVPDEVIEAAVEELQTEGIFDWAPTPAHPDRRDSASLPALTASATATHEAPTFGGAGRGCPARA
jgi:hypothetical protein